MVYPPHGVGLSVRRDLGGHARDHPLDGAYHL